MEHILYWLVASAVVGAIVGPAMRSGGLKRRGASIVIDIALAMAGGVGAGVATIYVADLRALILKYGQVGTLMEFSIVLAAAMLLVVVYDFLLRKQSPLYK